jgi:hypothetical protein
MEPISIPEKPKKYDRIQNPKDLDKRGRKRKNRGTNYHVMKDGKIIKESKEVKECIENQKPNKGITEAYEDQKEIGVPSQFVLCANSSNFDPVM